ncbi:MAG TPA: hypothetical protein VL284_11130 [Thermoanaerobaculia bacterium]|nr:hypothetical protein [Thermoanaerobaculia bacterium]
MRNISLALVSMLIVAACATHYGNRYGYGNAPEFWGTVTYVDAGANRIDLDYVGPRGRHYARSVYYDPRATRWDGVGYRDLRRGDRIYVNGGDRNGRYWANSIRRY